MFGLVAAFDSSFVEGAKCYKSEIEHLRLSSLDFGFIGQQTDLRITQPFTLHNHPKGICEGFSLVFARYCLALNEPDCSQLQKVRMCVLKRHNLECFFLQNLQDELMGLNGTPDAKLVQQWSEAIDEIGPSDPLINLRRCLLRMSRHVTPNLYATILEIDGLYRAKLCPGEGRFFRLCKDVLSELSSLAGVKNTVVNHLFCYSKELKAELAMLPKGVYHIGMLKHAWIYLAGNQNYFCDVNFEISTSLKTTVSSQWVTITRLDLFK